MVIIITIHLTHDDANLMIAAEREGIMRNLKYETVDFEEPGSQTEDRMRTDRRPYLVSGNPVRFGDEVMDRPLEILDYVLAQGSMPA
jgi:hypothetical protein